MNVGDKFYIFTYLSGVNLSGVTQLTILSVLPSGRFKCQYDNNSGTGEVSRTQQALETSYYSTPEEAKAEWYKDTIRTKKDDIRALEDKIIILNSEIEHAKQTIDYDTLRANEPDLFI